MSILRIISEKKGTSNYDIHTTYRRSPLMQRNSYYGAYMKYFQKCIEEQGVDATLENMIFAPNMNIPSEGKDGQWMCNRFLSALFHPMIHTAYGLEFGVNGIVVEGKRVTLLEHIILTNCIGLAWAALHWIDAPFVIQPLYDKSLVLPPTNGVNGHTAKINGHHTAKGVDILTVVFRVLSDQRWSTIEFSQSEFRKNFQSITHSKEHCAAIVEHVRNWVIDTSDGSQVEKKIEELQWMAVLLFAAPKAEGEPRADFFL
jgi:hypothetical protein